jgi:Carboxypeptidase regulatory-like domain
MRPDCEFAACPSSASNALSPNIRPVATGRIEGKIELYPAFAVERADQPNRRGIPGQVTADDAGGSVVAQVSSDAQGRFYFDLPPGRYTLRLMSVRPPGHAEPVPVTVEVGQVTKAVITFDAGIR